jgi:hypothetical protein
MPPYAGNFIRFNHNGVVEEVVGDGGDVWRLRSGRIAKKRTEGEKWCWMPTVQGQGGIVSQKNGHFQHVHGKGGGGKGGKGTKGGNMGQAHAQPQGKGCFGGANGTTYGKVVDMKGKGGKGAKGGIQDGKGAGMNGGKGKGGMKGGKGAKGGIVSQGSGHFQHGGKGGKGAKGGNTGQVHAVTATANAAAPVAMQVDAPQLPVDGASLFSTAHHQFLLPAAQGDCVQIGGEFKRWLPQAEVISIEKVIFEADSAVQRTYQFTLDKIKRCNLQHGDSESVATPDVRHLWHGTGSNHPAVVYEGLDGFDMRYSQSGMWGRAIYFATTSAYSNR